MLKVKKKITRLPVKKNEEFVQLRSEIKNTIKNLVDEKNKIAKIKDRYVKIIQQIKTEYQKVTAENERLKKYVEQYENEKKEHNVIKNKSIQNVIKENQVIAATKRIITLNTYKKENQ